MPPLTFNVPEVPRSDRRVDAELRTINVRLASKEERLGKLDTVLIESGAGGNALGPNWSAGSAVTEQWRLALQDALDRSLFFRDNAPTTLTISVIVLRIDTPAFAGEFRTTSTARYEVINRTTGETVWGEEITTVGSSPLSEAFVGTVRARQSVNRSIQENIKDFLSLLQTSFVLEPNASQSAREQNEHGKGDS